MSVKNCKSVLGNITVPLSNQGNASLTSAYPPNNQKLVMACACMARALADVAHHEMQIWLQSDSGLEQNSNVETTSSSSNLVRLGKVWTFQILANLMKMGSAKNSGKHWITNGLPRVRKRTHKRRGTKSVSHSREILSRLERGAAKQQGLLSDSAYENIPGEWNVREE